MDHSALVLGGTGYIGEAVLRALSARGVKCTFVYGSNDEKAQALGHTAIKHDLRDPAGLAAKLEGLTPTLLIHAAAPRVYGNEDLASFNEAMAVYGGSALVALSTVEASLKAVVLLSAIDVKNPIPMPSPLAAAQAALVGLAKAWSKRLGPKGVRVNVVCPGVLDGGVSRGIGNKERGDFKKHSALGRLGTSDEVAQAVVYLALDNTYMTGATLSVNGGL